MTKPSRIQELIARHEAYRAAGINLIASENVLSGAARKALASDLGSRYHSSWYGGSLVSRQLIDATEELARRVFRAEHAIVSPLSGNVCDLAVMLAFTEPGDRMAMLPFSAGGYPLGVEKFHRKRAVLPYRDDTLEVDLDALPALLRAETPRLTLLAASFIPFPLPVSGVARAVKEARPSSVFVYDGSHVLGLIACGGFQDPLREGADVLIGSTHKSLYGPQGGLILTNSAELDARLRSYVDFDLEGGLGLVDNPHLNRIAALGIALEEILEDRDYGRLVVANARALASALDRGSVPVRFKGRGFTASHQVLLDLEEKRAIELCGQLESVAIFGDLACRFGTAEVTRQGLGEPEMWEIGEMIAEVYHKGPSEAVRARVAEFVDSV